MTPKQQRLRVDHPDRIDLARAVEAEGEPRELVAQALINRWAHLRDAGAVTPLGEFVRAYAQPISPRWFPTGDLHLAAMRAASSDTERAELEARADRRVHTHAIRTLFQPATLAAVKRALGGPLTIDPRVVHFAIDTPARRARFPLITLANGVGFYGAAEGNAQRYSIAEGGPSWLPARVLDDGRAATGLAFAAGLFGLVAIKGLAMRRGRRAH